MKKNIFVFLLFAFSSLIFSQHNQLNSYSKATYMLYKNYKSLKKSGDKVIDSIGFNIIKNDTLIMIIGYKEKGVKVLYEEKDSIFLERYKQLVFNKKYQNKEERLKPTMKIWKDEVKIYFDKSVSKYNSKKLSEFIHYLDEEIDSLKITVVKDKDKSNYFIYSISDTNEVNLDARIRGNDGYYLLWNNKQNIYSCSLKINQKKNLNEEQILTYLKINFIRSLGYFYQELGNSDCNSYFSICKSDKKEFGNKDLEILKYHYSYGICKGSNIETFEKNHKDAKEALKKGNTKFYFLHNE
ncbi:hypothetical protein [Flavobacterium algoritolerans]|uniref:Uncharacterized protein n=1 Tax=Flavobacterium algoritolerans TaxID=3041254 RepID=A0ABT6VDM9_9FLAO|nr:hypothetical protein [Flavobacterium algoritolerans]MDI5896341.1 hypothetical protein [Flavobacterium algoritolerans]